MGEFPDDLNEWSKENLEEVKSIFERASKLDKVNSINKEDKIERDNPIKEDDIIDLKIVLENAKTVDDFLRMV